MTAVAEVVVDLLVAAGVRRAYTVPGESFLPLLDAFDRHPDIALVSTRHESGAAFMAEADAKLTGVPAVVLATRAVGAANAAIGVHTADQDSTPMVVLLGQVESANLGREAFQEVDLPRFYTELTKWSATASAAAEIPALVTRALHLATTGRPGPTMLALPSDLLTADVVDIPSTPDPEAAGVSLEADAAAIAEALSGARAPVVIAGGGAQGAREQLVAVVERFGCGVYAAFRRQDVFPNDHPGYCGVLTIGTAPETLAALREADVVLAVGTRLSEITTQGYRLPRPDQRLLQIDIEPRSIGAVLPIETGMVADAAAALDAVLAHAPRDAPARDWSAAHRAFVQASTPTWSEGPGIHPAAVMAALARAFPADTIVANDAGNFSAFAHRYWRFTQPRTQLGPTSGAMGYGVPAAIAAALAAPGREVLALAGDGGFLMSGQELETGVRLGLAFTVVVFRNGLYGTIALHQARDLGRTAAVAIGDVDVAGLARAYGAAAWCPATLAELDVALAEARTCGRPAVVDVVTDPDVLSPTATLSGLLAKERS